MFLDLNLPQGYTMIRWFSAFKLFLFLTCAFLTAELVAETATKPQKILVLGDSISAGYRVPLEQGWVQLVENQLKVQYPHIQLINASVSGDTTSNGLARLPSLLERHQPDMVIIELGGNDGLRGVPIKNIEANLTKLITLSQQAGAQVILAGMQIPPSYGPFYAKPFADMYPKLAQKHGTALIPFLLEGVGGNQELMQADGIHPNTKGQPVLAQNALKVISQLL